MATTAKRSPGFGSRAGMHGREERSVSSTEARPLGFRILPPILSSVIGHRSLDDPRGSRVKHCNSTLAALPGEHLLLTRARDSARRALTFEFPTRPPTLTHLRLSGADTRQFDNECPGYCRAPGEAAGTRIGVGHGKPPAKPKQAEYVGCGRSG